MSKIDKIIIKKEDKPKIRKDFAPSEKVYKDKKKYTRKKKHKKEHHEHNYSKSSCIER